MKEKKDKEDKKDTYYKLLLAPLGMYCLMILIAIFWFMAELFQLTHPVWLNIGVATGILFMVLSFMAPLVGLVMEITGALLRRKYIIVADPTEKGTKYWRSMTVLNLGLGTVSVALCVYFILLIQSL